jgi:hypothetical protein
VSKDELDWNESLFQVGVLDYIEKPRLDRFEEVGASIASVIRAVSKVDLKNLAVRKPRSNSTGSPAGRPKKT